MAAQADLTGPGAGTGHGRRSGSQRAVAEGARKRKPSSGGEWPVQLPEHDSTWTATNDSAISLAEVHALPAADFEAISSVDSVRETWRKKRAVRTQDRSLSDTAEGVDADGKSSLRARDDTAEERPSGAPLHGEGGSEVPRAGDKRGGAEARRPRKERRPPASDPSDGRRCRAARSDCGDRGTAGAA